jgi:hypothetical protein
MKIINYLKLINSNFNYFYVMNFVITFDFHEISLIYLILIVFLLSSIELQNKLEEVWNNFSSTTKSFIHLRKTFLLDMRN